ncbi:MAG: transposase family protein [Deltaproteobacteria bacterium]|nr:transposase family protein [Deltaproteobacteria bacterium]
MEDRLVTSRMLVLAALDDRQLATVLDRITDGPRRGRPWSCSLRQRVVIACVALRTNLTIRELAAVFGISKSAAHRMVARCTAQLARGAASAPRDRRESWIVDGTLVPTPRPPPRCQIEELSMVVQRPDSHPSARPLRRRDRRRWTRLPK